MSYGKSIKIFLPDGNPSSIRTAEVLESTINAFSIPRSEIKSLSARQELNNVGLYFLFGETDEAGKHLVYIGESEDIASRIRNHHKDKNKDWWNTAILFYSSKTHVNKAIAKYLENFAYTEALRLKQSVLKNNSTPQPVALSDADISLARHFFEDIKLLLTTLGYPIYREVTKQQKILYYFSTKQADAKGVYSPEGFTVLEQSKANIEETASFNESSKRLRKELLEAGVLRREGDVFVFTQDYTFKTPSAAADTVAARSANGWTAWKTKKGQTLDELERAE